MNITRVNIRVLETPGPIKAQAEIIIEDSFIVRGLTIRENSSGECFVAYPYRFKDNGGPEKIRVDVAHPLTRPMGNYIEGKVIDAYEEELNRRPH